MKFKKLLSLVKYFFYLVIVTTLLLEIILRFYNPFPNRISKGRLILSANRTFYQPNGKYGIPGVDSVIKTTINSMGFRGPELPKDYPKSLSIFTVGGSTTFCLFLNEEKSWPHLLQKSLSKDFKNVWLNNAGINGQSTYGHKFLMEDYIIPLQPKVVIFLIGLNDIDRTYLVKDSDHLKGKGSRSFSIFLEKNSEVYNLYKTITSALNVKRFNFPLPNVDLRQIRFDTLNIPESDFDRRLKLENDMLTGYSLRVNQLINLCQKNNIYPIFINQPLLIGPVYDSLLKADLSNIKLNDSTNSLFYWRKLSMYNDELKAICTRQSIPLIDLASTLPKSSRYYYDIMHYNNAGAAKIDSIIAPQIKEYLKVRFPDYYTGN